MSGLRSGLVVVVAVGVQGSSLALAEDWRSLGWEVFDGRHFNNHVLIRVGSLIMLFEIAGLRVAAVAEMADVGLAAVVLSEVVLEIAVLRKPHVAPVVKAGEHE